MPNFNDAGTIGEALEALLAQAYPRLEVIVVDDASTDESLQVIARIAKADPRVTVVRHHHNMGPIRAQLTGFARATGEYVFGPSANDRVLPGFLEKVVACLEEHPTAGAAFCDVICLDDADRHEIAALGNRPTYLSAQSVTAILRRRHAFMLGGTALTRRSAFEEAGWLIPDLKWMADFFALHVVAFRHGVCHVPESLYAVRSPSYSRWGPASPAHREAIVSMLTLLDSPDYADVRLPFDRSAILSVVPGILSVLLGRPEYHSFLEPMLMTRALQNEIKSLLRPLAPRWLTREYRRLRRRCHPSLLAADGDSGPNTD
jgi:glycosyltransferase involved in cell wall biosynthesis